MSKQGTGSSVGTGSVTSTTWSRPGGIQQAIVLQPGIVDGGPQLLNVPPVLGGQGTPPIGQVQPGPSVQVPSSVGTGQVGGGNQGGDGGGRGQPVPSPQGFKTVHGSRLQLVRSTPVSSLPSGVPKPSITVPSKIITTSPDMIVQAITTTIDQMIVTSTDMTKTLQEFKNVDEYVVSAMQNMLTSIDPTHTVGPWAVVVGYHVVQVLEEWEMEMVATAETSLLGYINNQGSEALEKGSKVIMDIFCKLDQ